MKAQRLIQIVPGVVMMVVSFASAQPPDTLWTRTYGSDGDDNASSVQQTFDGGFILAGATNSFGSGSSDAWIIKTNAEGTVEWDTTLGGTGLDWGYWAEQTNDSGYVLVGYLNYTTDSSKILLAKLDKTGSLDWQTTINFGTACGGTCVRQTNDGGYVVTGEMDSSPNVSDVLLLKTDENGTVEWHHSFGGNATDFGWGLEETQDGGFIVVGCCNLYGVGSSHIWLIKTDENGDSLWSKTFGDSALTWGLSVHQTQDLGYILVGSAGDSAENFAVYLVKTDSLGNEIWHKTFSENASNWGDCVWPTTDGGYVISGLTGIFGDAMDAYIVKTDAQGEEQWHKILGGTGYDLSVSIQQTTDGGYIAAGGTSSYGAGSGDAWLIRLDQENSIISNHSSLLRPVRFTFYPPSPNPFNPSTVLSYELRVPSRVKLAVFDLAGRLVTVLLDTWQAAGNHRVTFDGAALTSGIYLARLTAGEFSQTQKLVLLK